MWTLLHGAVVLALTSLGRLPSRDQALVRPGDLAPYRNNLFERLIDYSKYAMRQFTLQDSQTEKMPKVRRGGLDLSAL